MATPENEDTIELVAVGNAIVDVLSYQTDQFVTDNGLIKAAMNLQDLESSEALLAKLAETSERSGGSAANSTVGFSSFGGSAAYIGKVSDDRLGQVFIDGLRAQGVQFEVTPAGDGPATARCLIIVTPDAQRTLNTYLGISSLLTPDDVDASLVARGKILFCEGYLWDVESAKQAIRKAIDVSAQAGNKVALTLSDTFCIERHHDEFSKLVSENVDILFANEAELTTLYRADLKTALKMVSQEVETAFVTLGKSGSMVVAGSETYEVAAEQIGDVIDTTGAGDQYAAGALFGLSRDLPLPEAGRLGSMAAAEVISHLGPRPERDLTEFLKQPS